MHSNSLDSPPASGRSWRNLRETLNRSNNIYIFGLACALLVYLALAIGTALTSRPIGDEGFIGDTAYTLATKGYMGTPALRYSEGGRLLRVDQHIYWFFPLQPLVLAAWYRLIGAGLFALRSFSLCFGLLGLGALFVFVQKLSKDSRLACLAVALTALDYYYIFCSASGRMDIMCAALGYGGLASYMALREHNLALAVLVSNSLIVASGTTHPHGFLYFMGLVFLVAYFDRQRITWKHISVAVVPYLIGATLWGLYISKDPEAFLAQIRTNAIGSGRFRGLKNPLMGFVREVTVRYADAYGFGAHSAGSKGPIYLKVLALLAYLVGVAGVLSVPVIRRRPEVRVMLWLIGVYSVYLAIFDGTKQYFYLVHLIPMYAALLAVLVSWLLLERKISPMAILLPLGLIMAVQVGGLAYRIRLNTYKNMYEPAVRYLQHSAQDDQLINGNLAFVFGLNFPSNLIDDETLNEIADFVIVDDEISLRLRHGKSANLPVYQHVVSVLANCYQKVYDRTSVEVYSLRKPQDDACEETEKHSKVAAP
jgi:hypothetical protein